EVCNLAAADLGTTALRTACTSATAAARTARAKSQHPRRRRCIPEPSVEMTTADLWAIANLRFKELPPVEYDHMPDKIVTITDISTEAELRTRCGWTDTGKTIVGCAAATDPHLCHIYLGPRPSWTGLTRNIVLRHEMGHCSGWPADHPGI